MKKVRVIALGLGVGGILGWLEILVPAWLKRELAYQRWRRSRTPQRLRSGHCLR